MLVPSFREEGLEACTLSERNMKRRPPKQFLKNAAGQEKIYPEFMEPAQTNAAGKSYKKDFANTALIRNNSSSSFFSLTNFSVILIFF